MWRRQTGVVTRRLRWESGSRWLAAVVTVLVGCGDPNATNGPGSSDVSSISRSATVPTDSDVGNVSVPSRPTPLKGFDVIAQGMRRTADRGLAVAVDTGALAELASSNDAAVPSSVDFRKVVVAVFTAPLDACSPELTGLELDGRTLTANFEPGEYECPGTTAHRPKLAPGGEG